MIAELSLRIIFIIFSAFVLNLLVQYLLIKVSPKNSPTDVKTLWKLAKKNKTIFWGINLSSLVSLTLVAIMQVNPASFLLSAIFMSGLIALSFVDLRTQLLPDIITKPLIVAGVVISPLGYFVTIQDSLLGAFIGYFSLWTINTIFRMVRKKEGMGYGDFKLLSAIGAWVGASQLFLVFVLSSLVGLIVAVTTIKLSSKDYSQPTPFGPSLAITGALVFLYGREILDYYYSFFSL